jgi:hypothetical protein
MGTGRPGHAMTLKAARTQKSENGVAVHEDNSPCRKTTPTPSKRQKARARAKAFGLVATIS